MLCLQEASEVSYVATMKTVRQVKTVFVIFIAFFCCWSPYVFVLLYDRSDTLPLSVHLYTSMLAHLHASLNFAIYSLNNQTFRAAYRRLVVRCCRPTTSGNARAAVGSSRVNQQFTSVKESGCFRVVNRTLISDECYQLQELKSLQWLVSPEDVGRPIAVFGPKFSRDKIIKCWGSRIVFFLILESRNAHFGALSGPSDNTIVEKFYLSW